MLGNKNNNPQSPTEEEMLFKFSLIILSIFYLQKSSNVYCQSEISLSSSNDDDDRLYQQQQQQQIVDQEKSNETGYFSGKY